MLDTPGTLFSAENGVMGEAPATASSQLCVLRQIQRQSQQKAYKTD